MILKKVIDNEKEIYVPISFEEAIEINDKSQLVFSSEEEEDKYDDYFEELEDEEDEDEDDNSVIDLDNLFSKFKTNSNGKAKNVNKNFVSLLPFLSVEDLRKIVDEYISGDSRYSDEEIVCSYPFLEDEELDRLFKSYLEKEDSNAMIATIIPFVSSETLNGFVDEFIEGKYQNINIKALYPFMSKEAISKLFAYFSNR